MDARSRDAGKVCCMFRVDVQTGGHVPQSAGAEPHIAEVEEGPG